MTQKYGYMANGVIKQNNPCIVCEDVKPTYSWTDFHGEGYCMQCGTPYDLKNEIPKIAIKPEWIPVLKQYWNETHKGNGQGTFLIWRDYPDQARDMNDFADWITNHPELMPKETV